MADNNGSDAGGEESRPHDAPTGFFARFKTKVASKLESLDKGAQKAGKLRRVHLNEEDHDFIKQTFKSNIVTYNQLGISKNDLRVLYKSFKSADHNRLGALDLFSFSASLGVGAKSMFWDLLFKWIDRNESDHLVHRRFDRHNLPLTLKQEFAEFSAGIFECCMFKTEQLPQFLFELFSSDSANRMSKANLQEFRRFMLPLVVRPAFDIFAAEAEASHRGRKEFRMGRRQLGKWMGEVEASLERVVEYQQMIQARFGGRLYWAQACADRVSVAKLQASVGRRQEAVAAAEEQLTLEESALKAAGRARTLAGYAQERRREAEAMPTDKWGREMKRGAAVQARLDAAATTAAEKAEVAAREARELAGRVAAAAPRVEELVREMRTEEEAEAAEEGGVVAGMAAPLTWGGILTINHGAWMAHEMEAPDAAAAAATDGDDIESIGHTVPAVSGLRQKMSSTHFMDLPKPSLPRQSRSIHSKFATGGNQSVRRLRTAPPGCGRQQQRRLVWRTKPLPIDDFRTDPSFYQPPAVKDPDALLAAGRQRLAAVAAAAKAEAASAQRAQTSPARARQRRQRRRSGHQRNNKLPPVALSLHGNGNGSGDRSPQHGSSGGGGALLPQVPGSVPSLSPIVAAPRGRSSSNFPPGAVPQLPLRPNTAL